MWAPALGRSARVAGTCLSLFSLLIRLVSALLCELASLSQTVPLLTYLLPCDLRKLPQMTASAFHFCPVCWQSQVCTWLGSRSTRSCHQSAVHLSTYRCPNSYTQPVSCKLNYKCFYICFKCALGWGWGGMCHSTSIEGEGTTCQCKSQLFYDLSPRGEILVIRLGASPWPTNEETSTQRFSTCGFQIL